MEFERKLILEKLKIMLKDGIPHLKEQDELLNKSFQKSVEARTHGNHLFCKKDHSEQIHEEIWKKYSESIAFAPNSSEDLAFGYANRSAFLLHLGKYRHCLLDIDRALKITKSCALKVKLFCRQYKCFAVLQDGRQSNSLEKAKFWLNKVDSSKEAEKLNKILQRRIAVTEQDIPDNEAKEKKTDIFCDNSSIDIGYDDKYGRFLFAIRDIKPGEFVCADKFYATCINRSKLHAYCSHCLGISWATIPCDHCAYYMYCSEECKNEAWKKYHDLECHVRFLKNENIKRDHVEISLRSLIMGLKEVGSFQQLKELVNEVVNSSGGRTKGFSKNGTFLNDSFRSLISLYHSIDEGKIRQFAVIAIHAAKALAENSKLFYNGLHVSNEYFMAVQQEDFVFIASLILRLLSICLMNDSFVVHMNRGCMVSKISSQCQRDCCLRGIGLSLRTSLINHSCDSNVDKFFTNDGRVVYYAVKPIKANSQIFSYYYNCHFLNASKAIRQSYLYRTYEFTCSCLACQQDWPDGAALAEKLDLVPLAVHQLLEDYKKLLGISLFDIDVQHSKKSISNFAKAIAKLCKYVTGPNAALESFRMKFNSMIENRYCSILRIPQTCKNMTNLH